jgi:hypothetical protein
LLEFLLRLGDWVGRSLIDCLGLFGQHAASRIVHQSLFMASAPGHLLSKLLDRFGHLVLSRLALR